uniref:Uncharacterized protein n=2 Tax=Ciona savignyi TaxID=51511 RepID=H2Z9Y7_CIOSA
MSLDVRDKLKKTTKGKLVYAKEKLPINVPSPSPAGIFGIHDIPVMLETLEEKAFNDEDELLLSSKSPSSSSQSKITTTQLPAVEFSNDDASIAFFDLNDKKISQNLIELQVGKYRDSVLEAHRESQRKFQETQERRKNLKMKENLLWTSYQQSEKGAEEKIRREFEQQHQQRSSLLKTRILEAEKRKVEQNKHRIQETENIVTVTTKLHSSILQLVENMRSLVSSDTDIVTLVTNCVQKYFIHHVRF